MHLRQQYNFTIVHFIKYKNLTFCVEQPKKTTAGLSVCFTVNNALRVELGIYSSIQCFYRSIDISRGRSTDDNETAVFVIGIVFNRYQRAESRAGGQTNFEKNISFVRARRPRPRQNRCCHVGVYVARPRVAKSLGWRGGHATCSRDSRGKHRGQPPPLADGAAR